MNASLIDSRISATSAGSPFDGTSRLSGIGRIQVASGRTSPSGESADFGGARSIGRARRSVPSSMSRQTFVAIRYNHDRTDERPSKLSKLFHARSRVSWTASSASNADPSIR
jgi:hypothetical protein